MTAVPLRTFRGRREACFGLLGLLFTFNSVQAFSTVLQSRQTTPRRSIPPRPSFPHQHPYRSAAPPAVSRSSRLQESNIHDDADIHKYPKLKRLNPAYPEEVAKWFVSENYASNPLELKQYVQFVTMIRVATPSTLAAIVTVIVYPSLSLTIAALINDSSVFDVVSTDASQYIQNILTTCGLMFVLLTGNTYYFLYSQQEQIFLSLFEEVTVAKSLLEQVALVCQGRTNMYRTLLGCIDRYVQEDLMQFGVEPSVLLSARPIDDPLEDIMYMTSVGEPSVVYQTVRTLRQARAHRLGALQRKLPQIHMILLWSLAAIVLCTFPLLGAGSQVIGGFGILRVQAFYLSFIVFGITLVLGVINELRDPGGKGAYNVVSVLVTMVQGLEDELEGRMEDKYISRLSPSIDVTVPDDEAALLSSLSSLEGEIVESETIIESIEEEHHQRSSPGLLRRIAHRVRNRKTK